MKKILLMSLVGFFCAPVSASEQGPIDRPRMEPVGVAQGKMKVTKSVVRRTAGGDFKFDSETICEKEIQVNIYDLRHGMSDSTFSSSAECETTLDGHDMKVKVYADIIYHSSDEAGQGRQSKDLWVSSMVYPAQSPSELNPHSTYLRAGTRDLNQKSFIVSMPPRHEWICNRSQDCNAGKPEALGITIETQE
ncbi:MAG: hypothetical protein KF802_08335 [Bdellovibrionaceae bacterium]|nr:hypothetical protein [Pseudobdellovibrionaceae bacterium]MBX3034940.1 hypothetical protein [Pseudobdellovibrionaceae bacterium]